MNEEEKAIEFLRKDIKFRKNNKWFENCIIEPKTAQILLNYIDKLQKENEDMREELQMYVDTDIMKLQEENKELKERNKGLTTALEEWINGERINDIKHIRKDKIKEALGDKNIPDEMILTYIETLVSENNRLEDIEDRKVQIEYNNVFNKGVKSVEDKIRTKIKELEDIKNKNIEYCSRDYFQLERTIKVLKELLGE